MILLAVISTVIFVAVLMISVVLVVPIRLAIDTEKDLYSIYQCGVFSVRLLSARDVILEVKIAGITVPLKTATQHGTIHKVQEGKPKNKKRKMRSVESWRFLFEKIFKAIRIQKFELDVDTNDFPLNAKLVPLFYFASNDSRVLSINFSGRNCLVVMARVRPLSLVRAYLLFLTKQ